MELVPLVILVLAGAMSVLAAARAISILRAGGRDATLQQDAEAVLLGELLERRRRLLEDIRVAGLDLDTGKMTADDHKRVVRRLEREVATVLRTLDELRGTDADREAAEAQLARHVRQARAERDVAEAGWSRAAQLRHGGIAPSPEAKP